MAAVDALCIAQEVNHARREARKCFVVGVVCPIASYKQLIRVVKCAVVGIMYAAVNGNGRILFDRNKRAFVAQLWSLRPTSGKR